MSSINSVTLIGRLTRDVELRYTPNGTAVATFSLAVDDRPAKNGDKRTNFPRIVVWGKLAETVANFLSKGRLAGISGHLATRSYEAKDGTRHYVAEVVASQVQFLDRPKGDSAPESATADESDVSEEAVPV